MNEGLLFYLPCPDCTIVTAFTVDIAAAESLYGRRRRWFEVEWQCCGCGGWCSGWFDKKHRAVYVSFYRGAPKPHVD